jgi:hypothetical protein
VQDTTTMLLGQLITGGLVFSTVTTWLQVALLLQQSVASQVRMMTCGQTPLVTVSITVIVTLLQHASKAVGASKLHAVPHSTVLLVAHISTGGLVFSTVTVWLQVALLPQASVISQVWVMICGQTPLVTVPVGVMSTLVTTPVAVITLLPQQVAASGGSNVQALPHSTVLGDGQITVMFVQHWTVTVKLQLMLLLHGSVAVHVTVVVVPG